MRRMRRFDDRNVVYQKQRKRRCRVTVAEVKADTAEVALRIMQAPGCQDGAAIPKPVTLAKP